ncbi:MAG: 50S ribosomal protein L25 [Myxococcota bacterium]|nr:50S ribosomal protein L25 [Myxococcota bacterium]
MSQLAVEVRESGGKGVARKLRQQGRIPAVLYGQGRDPVSLVLEPRVLEKLLHDEGHNALFDLEADGLGSRTVLVKSLQRHPVRGELIHADFFEINVSETITVSVTLHLVGTPVGVTQDDGIVDHQLREVELDCLPRAIPESIDIDVAAMNLGETLHVSDLILPEGVEMKTHAELAVVSVVVAKIEEEAAPVVDEDAEGAEEGEGAVDGEASAEDGEGEGDKPSDKSSES